MSVVFWVWPLRSRSAPSQQTERQLAAVVAADIAGYSRLMGADEEGTLAALKACRSELIDPGIDRHRGRIVKTTGDGLLIEFSSPVEAVRWAVGERKRLVDEGLTRSQATAEAVASAQKLKHLTPHHLRHTAAALLWAAGASDIEVQLILGHADIETSKRLYAHLLDGSQDSAAARVEQLREARRATLT